VFLGEYKSYIYLLDKKEEKEYKISIKKDYIEEIDFMILKNNKLVTTTYQNIVNNNLKFTKDKTYTYEIINEKLYLINDTVKTKVSNQNVQRIVNVISDTVYYISNENLYMFNNIYGEVLLLSNFEWNFNHTNMVYIYK